MAPTKSMSRSWAATTRFRPASISADLITILIGLTSSFTIHVVGELSVSGIIFVPLLPILIIVHRRKMSRPRMNVVFLLLGLWLLGQALTDIYRHTAPHDWMRGDALIIFFAIALASFAMLLPGNEHRKAIFIGAYAVGSLLAARFQPIDLQADDPWKFGYASGTMLLVTLASCYFFRRRQYIATATLLLGIAVVNLLKNYRTPVFLLLLIIVLILPVIPDHIGRLRLLPSANSAARVALLACMALVAGMVALVSIHLATAYGLLGLQAQAKNQEQSQAAGGILLAGRPEILVSARAVWDSPILGHGSWAQDYTYVEMLSDILVKNGISSNIEELEETDKGFIPSHSHIMGAWVWAGILGAVFWIYIFWLVLKGILQVSLQRPALAPTYALLFAGFAWSIWFSPFGGMGITPQAFAIVIILDLLDNASPPYPHSQRIRRSLSHGFLRSDRVARSL